MSSYDDWKTHNPRRHANHRITIMNFAPGAYLLLEIALCLLFGPPILYALFWIVGETVEHFSR